MENLVKRVNDLSIISSWITDVSIIDILASCLHKINQISVIDNNKRVVKQIGRLLGMYANIQERLPEDLHQNLFVRLLQPIINCLTSSTFLKLFQELKPTSNSLTPNEKFFLIKCPHFLTSYQGK